MFILFLRRSIRKIEHFLDGRLRADLEDVSDFIRRAAKPRPIEQMGGLGGIKRIVGGWLIRRQQGMERGHGKFSSAKRPERSAPLKRREDGIITIVLRHSYISPRYSL